MKFPQVIRHRKVEATIYGKSPHYQRYRLAYYVAGQRSLRSFTTYSEAKTEAERIVRELADGSQAAALTGGQSRDALAALEKLESFRISTGRRVSLLGAVSEFVEAASKLNGQTMGEAVERYLNTVASVKRKDVSEAIEEFIASRKHLSEATEGKRAQLSPVYAYNVAMWLREFANAFAATSVCDLTQQHLDAYMQPHRKLSAKSRNDRRATVRMFSAWCVRQDYLSATHRMLEADCMNREGVDIPEIDYYRPAELRALLETADKDLLPVIALGGLAGLRGEEIMRLDWGDAWRVPGHIEITARKSKTSRRRLVEICPALAAWLEPFRECSGPVWRKSVDAYQEGLGRLRDTLKIPTRRNGLRHSFCSYHFALHSNENLTSAQVGNSPAIIHAHYKGLATRAEAERWFHVVPTKAENMIALNAAKG